MIVFDTSVILPFVRKDDPRHPMIRKALRRHRNELVVAPLWRSELRSALRKYVRANEMTVDTARRAFGVAESVFGPREREPSTARVFALADEFRISTYDAEHLALAVEGGGLVLTDDQRSLGERAPAHCLSLASFV